MRNIEDLTGLKAAERSVRQILKGKGGASDYAIAGVTALPLVGSKVGRQVVARVARGADEALLGQRVRNKVVPAPNPTAKATVFDRHPLTSPDQIKYAQRKMSPAELADAIKTGRFRVPKGGTKFSAADDATKWWSAADDAGAFGRPWNRRGTVNVRLPVDKVPSNRAARVKHAEIQDKSSGSWAPVKRKANGGEMNVSRSNITAPVKKAAGGVAKVRKGMATPEGKIIDAMNKIRGK
jgi:hypothetical protein